MSKNSRVGKSEIRQRDGRKEEVVEVAKQLRGLVIGTRGRTIRKIRATSGAAINNHQNGFLVVGSEQQRERAKEQILQTLAAEPNELPDPEQEMLDIPDEFKGLVIGRGRQTLNEISTRTGAHLFCMDRNVYMTGSQEAKEKARYEVQFIVAGGRMIDRNQRMRSCCFVDDFNLPKNCDLCLVPDRSISATVLPTMHTQYRLRLSEDCQASNISSTSATNSNANSNGVPCYLKEITDYVKRSLVEIKDGIDSGERRNNDMWCHFGTVVIRDMDEKDAGKQWTLADAAQNLAVPSEMEGNNEPPLWRTIFGEGVTFDAEDKLGEYLNKPKYDARHDISILTPSGRAVRCKVWIRHKEQQKNSEQCEIPFNDIKNIVEEICFKNEQTKAQCKGWLCLPSTKKLKADIIFPACEFDCRLTLRTSQMFAKEQSSTDEKENKILLDYFSDLTLKEGEELQFPDEKLPSGFQVIYNRCSRRASYFDGEDFTIIVSRETTYPSGKEVMDLHLHCNEWDELLRSAEWKPEQIIEKFPGFLGFVSRVQQLILHDQEEASSRG